MFGTNWTLSVVLVLILVGIVLLSRVLSRSWFAPGPFFGAYWLIMTAIPLLVAPDFDVHPAAVAWIVLSVMVLQCGSMVGQAVGTTSPIVEANLGGRLIPRLRKSIVLFSAMGMGVLIAHLNAFGLNFSVFLSIADLAESGRSISVARYHEDYSGPFISRLLLIFMYLSCPLGGLLAGLSKGRRDRLFSLAPFIPVLGVTAILTTKATMLVSAAFWLGGMIAVHAFQRKPIGFLDARTALKTAAAALIVAGVLVGSSMARYGWSGWSGIMRVINRLRTYAFGHISGFSHWFEDVSHFGQPRWGERTVAGLFDALNLADRKQGIFQDFALISHDKATNIYTFHRGLIEDFTLAGAVVVLFIVGSIAGFVFSRIERGHFDEVGIVIVFYAFTLWGFVVSLMNYNSTLAVSCILIGSAISRPLLKHALKARSNGRQQRAYFMRQLQH